MNAARWPFLYALAVLVALEAVYMTGTRLLIDSGDPNSIGIELERTLLRLISAGAVWGILGGILEKARAERWKLNLWWLLPITALAGCLTVPVLCGDWNLPEGETRLVFAMTSLVVGIREELVYRGVLQTLLEKKLGLRWAIVITTICFAFYHYGAQPWTVFTVGTYITFGIILGLLYARTRSLWLVIWIHTLYDAIWCYTPYLAHPWAEVRTLPIFAAAVLMILTWYIYGRRKGSA